MRVANKLYSWKDSDSFVNGKKSLNTNASVNPVVATAYGKNN